jgi:hypothetical protein
MFCHSRSYLQHLLPKYVQYIYQPCVCPFLNVRVLDTGYVCRRAAAPDVRTNSWQTTMISRVSLKSRVLESDQSDHSHHFLASLSTDSHPPQAQVDTCPHTVRRVHVRTELSSHAQCTAQCALHVQAALRGSASQCSCVCVVVVVDPSSCILAPQPYRRRQPAWCCSDTHSMRAPSQSVFSRTFITV